MKEDIHMAWKKPTLTEIACGMEINMYAPAEDEPVLF
ncbi:pyrroloquinoline quinone precursor peptide PqqA [Paracoccus sp. R86501]